MFSATGILCVLVLKVAVIDAATKLETDVLNAHNKYRAMHGVPPVTLDNKLSEAAQEWADHLGKIQKMVHRPIDETPYGENLYASPTEPVDGTAAIKAFYDEIRFYNYNNPIFSLATSHFTQVVWKDTTKIGVGVSTGGRYKFLVVTYDPPGNGQGQFATMVTKLVATTTKKPSVTTKGTPKPTTSTKKPTPSTKKPMSSTKKPNTPSTPDKDPNTPSPDEEPPIEEESTTMTPDDNVSTKKC